MADLIDRDALLKDMGLTDAVKYGNKTAEQQYRSYSTWMSYEIADAIWDAPAVNRWIPVSDKLPDDIGMVLITWVNHEPESYYSDIKDVPHTGAGHYFNGKWFWHSAIAEDCIAEYGSACGIDCMDDAIEVISWMPLPDAYEPPEKE